MSTRMPTQDCNGLSYIVKPNNRSQYMLEQVHKEKYNI